jgi:hypothetical protein
MANVASVNDPGHDFQKYILVEASSEAEANALAQAEASSRNWSITASKESPIGSFRYLCSTPYTTKPYPPGF